MSLTRKILRVIPLAATIVAAGGCGSAPAPSSTKAGAVLLETGGVGGAHSGVFKVEGRGIQVDYKLQKVPSSGSVMFTIERYKDEGQTATFSTITRPATSATLEGSFPVSLVRGDYRLRVDTDCPWSAKILASH